MDTTLIDPLVGTRLDGRYRIERRIAGGGMSVVYLATDTRLERKVAVKVMHPAYPDAANGDFVARFVREAKAAARLSHPNVVAVFDQGADAGALYLVMEYVAGHTLRELLTERGRLPPGEALAVVEPVLAALAAAHDAGLVHRDVKPENVLLADDGRVKVADFGLARAVADANHTVGLLIGTVAYLAPERVADGRDDARSDVYSVGVLLFELLTGRTPFAGNTPILAATARLHEPVPPPSAFAPEVPAALDALLARATERDPDRRPADAGELLIAVTGLRQSLGYRDRVPPVGAGSSAAGTDTAVLATPAPPARRRWRWRTALVVLVLILLAAAAGLTGWWFGSGRYVRAPALLDLSYARAGGQARHDGLRLRLGPPVYSDTVPKGEVVDQHPGPERSVVRGSTITVQLSLGVLTRPVPDVARDSVAAATAALARQTLVVAGEQHAYSSSVPAGLVIGTDPPAGQVLRHGSAVTLIVSAGPQPVTVPAVDATPLAAAEATLHADGLGYRLATAVYSNSVPAGEVAAQSPGPGTTVDIGTQIVLTPSLGPQLFPVPNVTYQSVSVAAATLQAAGFAVRIDQLPGGPGIVLKQSPGGGSMAQHGATVTLYVF